MMNRRQFLRTAISAGSVLAVDPEKLLWTPTKTIFIPSGIDLADKADMTYVSGLGMWGQMLVAMYRACIIDDTEFEYKRDVNLFLMRQAENDGRGFEGAAR